MADEKPSVMDSEKFPAAAGEVEAEVETAVAEVQVEAPVALREDQVKTAVSFLSHPKVRGSPIQFRRSFLEKKGLTKDEIDEAFRRVPDPSTSETANAATTSSPTTPATSVRPRVPPPPPAAASGSPPAGLGTSSPPPSFPPQTQYIQPQQYALQPTGLSAGQLMVAQPVPAAAPPSKMHWAQVTLAVALLGAAGAGAAVIGQKVLFPKFQAWLRRIVLGEDGGEVGADGAKAVVPTAPKRTAAEEAALSAASAAASVAAAVQEMAKSRSDDVHRLDLIAKTMELQMLELRTKLVESLGALKESTSAELREEFRSFALGMSAKAPVQTPPIAGSQALPPAQALAGSGHIDSIQSTSASPASVLPSAPDVAAAYQMGRAIRARPNPPSESSGGGLSQAPHSASYMEVMDMLQRGEKPPNIREVNDKPPNPSQAPSNAQLTPRAKPWEQQRPSPSPSPIQPANPSPFGTATPSTPLNPPTNGPDANQWWRKPPHPSMTEREPVAINGSGTANGANGSVPAGNAPAGGSSGIERAVGKSGWVPPAAPSTVMPGALAAMGYRGATPAVPEASSSDVGSSSQGADGERVEAGQSNERTEVGDASNGHPEPHEGSEGDGATEVETVSKKPSYKDMALAEAQS